MVAPKPPAPTVAARISTIARGIRGSSARTADSTGGRGERKNRTYGHGRRRRARRHRDAGAVRVGDRMKTSADSELNDMIVDHAAECCAMLGDNRHFCTNRARYVARDINTGKRLLRCGKHLYGIRGNQQWEIREVGQ